MSTFDAASLLAEFDDEGLVRDLARLLIDTTPPQLAAVQAAIDTRDAAALRSAAHKLRGSIASFGVPAAVEVARQLEAMGTAGDLNGAEDLGRRLAADVQLLRESARAWLDGGSTAPS